MCGLSQDHNSRAHSLIKISILVRNAMTSSNKGVSLGVVSLVAIAIILVAGFGAFLSTTLYATETSSPESSVISSDSSGNISALPSGSALCLYQIPANAAVTGFSNSSSAGNFVMFANGTRIFFPLDGCPQPVSPELYSIVSVIVQNASFIAAEQGSNFAVGQWMPYSFYNDAEYAALTFTHYSNEMYQPCGGSLGWVPEELGQIQVSIQEQTSVSYDFSNMSIYTVPSYELNIFHCPTVITTGTIAKTVTINGTSTSLGANAISVTKSDGEWEFTLTVEFTGSDINHVLIADGITVDGNLTYTGDQSQNVYAVEPFLAGSLAIFSSTNESHAAWAFQPSTVIFSATINFGHQFGDSINIPDASWFHSGETYTINAQPIVYESSSSSSEGTTSTSNQLQNIIQSDLEITMNFSLS
jgi:hypothetical protein